MNNKQRLAMACSMISIGLPHIALAQTAPTTEQQSVDQGSDAAGVGDIVVTAQKRSQKLNDIGMTVVAVSGEDLVSKGITDTSDLGKIVTGFRAAPSNNQTPVYTLRGVGLYDSGLSASPTVSVYVDEVALAFPIMTRAATLDLERVEVLKGPQGTLFGQNSTGGAINYIAAKPTSELEAGLNLSYARFGKVEASGFVSGPVTDTLKARLAVRAIEGGAWQRSQTRPDDRLGASDEIQARLLLDWEASDRLKFAMSVTGSRDNSDTIAQQLLSAAPAVPALAAPGLIGSPLATGNPRDADWTPGFSNRSKDRFFQAAVRGEYELSDSVSLISITSYTHQKVDKNLEQDGSAAFVVQIQPYGKIEAIGQELRLAGSSTNLNWIAGANFDHAKVSDNFRYLIPFVSTNQPIPGAPRFEQTLASTDQRIKSYAAFGNVELKLGDAFTVHAGARWTKTKRNGDSCTADPSASQATTGQFNAIMQLFADLGVKTTPVVPIQPFQCLQLSPPPLVQANGPIAVGLNEDNLSWRAGIDYKTLGGTLLYGSISRGYKAGVISPVGAVFETSYTPVKQERVDAYEVGFKAPLFDRLAQFNAAAFYYDYADKQLRTRIVDPFIGYLEVLDNVPKSRIYGAEAELIARPVPGFDLSLSGTYLNTKVTSSYITTNGQGQNGDFKGSRLPYSPKLSAVADVQYAWPVGDLRGFVGGSVTYNSSAQATFITGALPANAYKLPGYALLDLRAGIGSDNDSWRVQIFGRNITNKLYVTNVGEDPDTRYRYVGMPATYGMTLTLRTRS